MLGPPRSGSTWASEVLASVPGGLRIHEPDSDPHVPFALLSQAGLGRYPLLGNGDDAPRYRELWSAALAGPDDPRRAVGLTDRALERVAKGLLRLSTLDDRNAMLVPATADPTPMRVRLLPRGLALTARPQTPGVAEIQVVKSVHTPTAADFVTAMTDDPVVVIRRNPLNAVASWLELGWKRQRLGGSPAAERAIAESIGGSAPPSDDAPILEHHAWSYAALTRSLDLAVEHHPEWIVVQHEDLCNDPVGGFRGMFETLDLPFTDEVVATLDERNRPSTGYETKRVASDQAERWKERLDDQQVATIRNIAASLSVDC